LQILVHCVQHRPAQFVLSSRNRSRFDFRPYFSNPVCAANVCCRTRLFPSTYTLSAPPVDRRVLQRFLRDHEFLPPNGDSSLKSILSSEELGKARLVDILFRGLARPLTEIAALLSPVNFHL